MALILFGRRLPILRYLSALGAKRDDNILSIHSSSSNCSRDAGSINNTPNISEKQDLSESSSGTFVTSQAATTTPSTAGSPTAASSQPTPIEDDEEWTEVVHSSGQVYYWNQRTGETTQLGEPKPKSDRSDSRGGSGERGRRAQADGGGRSADGHVDPRAEAHLEDRTGTYAAMGVIIGAFLGWVSQFI